MSISPPSDIVLDVAKAADPSRYRAAASRLARLAATVASDTPENASLAAAARQPWSADASFGAAAAMARPRSGGTPSAATRRPYQQFEAFVLQSFIQSMLPKADADTFGSGTAGRIWRSMLAEQLGAQLAASGGIGLAALLRDADPVAGQPEQALSAPETDQPDRT